jgi:hypothetical protein
VCNRNGVAAGGHGIKRVVGALLALVEFLWIACGGVVVVARGRCCLASVRLNVHKPRCLSVLGFCLYGLRICLSFSQSVFALFVVFLGGGRGRGIDV